MPPLEPDICFHIFNHANGFENVFCKEDNYRYFLEKYWLHISPIAETYAYCLMPNHFHLVVRIRKRKVIEALIRNKNNAAIDNFSNNFSKVQNFGKVDDSMSDRVIEKFLSKQFANLFSCYTQSFNKFFHRRGSLFIKNFKRDPIFDKQHFLNAIIYTHRNPIHHGFKKKYDEWDYSSYNEIEEGCCEHLEVAKLLQLTHGLELLNKMHLNALENFENPYDMEML